MTEKHLTSQPKGMGSLRPNHRTKECFPSPIIFTGVPITYHIMSKLSTENCKAQYKAKQTKQKNAHTQKHSRASIRIRFRNYSYVGINKFKITFNMLMALTENVGNIQEQIM